MPLCKPPLVFPLREGEGIWLAPQSGEGNHEGCPYGVRPLSVGNLVGFVVPELFGEGEGLG